MSRITYDIPEISDETVHWTGHFIPKEGRALSVYYRFKIPADKEFIPHIRPFLLTFLLPAMRLGEAVELPEAIDEVTRRNLMEWQHAYALAFPELNVVELRDPMSKSATALPVREGGICAFSGGVDSCYTAFRDQSDPLIPSLNIKAGLMVHGFDIPLDQKTEFERAWKRSMKLLSDTGIEAYHLETDSRLVTHGAGVNWQRQGHGILLAAALSCYESFFDQVVIPSTYSYTGLKFPWGSCPATDYLFASSDTSWWHDGAAFNKLAKVRAIAEFKAVQENIRVCWEGDKTDRNCGQCFKCVATQICFWLSGVQNPRAFENPCNLKRVSSLYLKESAQNIALFRQFEIEAQQLGMNNLARACRSAFKNHKWLRLKTRTRKNLRKIIHKQ